MMKGESPVLKSNEIRTVTFDKSMRGYRCEDVDAFLRRVADQVDQQEATIADLEKKLQILAQRIEGYRADEDTLKTALLNAQRLGENVIHEAKQKAEGILREASLKAESLNEQAKGQVLEQRMELERVQSEVAHFKASVLSLYKSHIESLSTLPGGEAAQEPEQPEMEEEVEELVQPEEQAAVETEEQDAMPAEEDLDEQV